MCDAVEISNRQLTHVVHICKGIVLCSSYFSGETVATSAVVGLVSTSGLVSTLASSQLRLSYLACSVVLFVTEQAK